MSRLCVLCLVLLHPECWLLFGFYQFSGNEKGQQGWMVHDPLFLVGFASCRMLWPSRLGRHAHQDNIIIVCTHAFVF